MPHHHDSNVPIRCSVVTISDTRTFETDGGGKLVVEYLEAAGHPIIERRIVRDEPSEIETVLAELVPSSEAVLMTGGTGISPRDNTFETVSKLIDKPLPGYGELFRMLSYEEIGSAAMLSRATGGVIGSTILLTMPGSTAAVRLAMERLIVPELGHLVWEARGARR